MAGLGNKSSNLRSCPGNKGAGVIELGSSDLCALSKFDEDVLDLVRWPTNAPFAGVIMG